MEISRLSRLRVALSELLYSKSDRAEWWPGIPVKGLNSVVLFSSGVKSFKPGKQDRRI